MSSFFKGKLLSEALIEDAIQVAQTEISPISDARGSEGYKRLLLGQLIKAHFVMTKKEVRSTRDEVKND